MPVSSATAACDLREKAVWEPGRSGTRPHPDRAAQGQGHMGTWPHPDKAAQEQGRTGPGPHGNLAASGHGRIGTRPRRDRAAFGQGRTGTRPYSDRAGNGQGRMVPWRRSRRPRYAGHAGRPQGRAGASPGHRCERFAVGVVHRQARDGHRREHGPGDHDGEDRRTETPRREVPTGRGVGSFDAVEAQNGNSHCKMMIQSMLVSFLSCVLGNGLTLIGERDRPNGPVIFFRARERPTGTATTSAPGDGSRGRGPPPGPGPGSGRHAMPGAGRGRSRLGDRDKPGAHY
jgi:hypothetical protein